MSEKLLYEYSEEAEMYKDKIYSKKGQVGGSCTEHNFPRTSIFFRTHMDMGVGNLKLETFSHSLLFKAPRK